MSEDTKEKDSREEAILPPPTQMLYMSYEGNWLTECTSEICKVDTSENEEVKICLDQTIMHAQGGGQPTDTGKLVTLDGGATIHVSKVLLDRETGVATHTGKLVSSENCSPRLPIVGEKCQVLLDQENRQILSECHSAGHVVDSAMVLCGKHFKPKKAYHFLDAPYVEYDGKIDPEEREEFLQHLQKAFQDLLEQDIDTKIELMSKEEADSLCNRQAQNFDMDVFADKRTNQIRVVTVAGYPCPCGGTHVRSTGNLRERGWCVTDVRNKKGVLRVKYGQSKE